MSRGAWKYTFTLANLALAAGLTEDEVRKAKRRGEFDPRDFPSVANWLVINRVQRAVRAL